MSKEHRRPLTTLQEAALGGVTGGGDQAKAGAVNGAPFGGIAVAMHDQFRRRPSSLKRVGVGVAAGALLGYAYGKVREIFGGPSEPAREAPG